MPLHLLRSFALSALMSAALCTGAQAQDGQAAPTPGRSVALQGIMGSKALLIIDGRAPRALGPGESSGPVKVIAVQGDQARISIDGVPATLRLGEAPASVGGKAPAVAWPTSRITPIWMGAITSTPTRSPTARSSRSGLARFASSVISTGSSVRAIRGSAPPGWCWRPRPAAKWPCKKTGSGQMRHRCRTDRGYVPDEATQIKGKPLIKGTQITQFQGYAELEKLHTLRHLRPE